LLMPGRVTLQRGEPKFHELQPAERLVAPTGRPVPGRVDLIGGAPVALQWVGSSFALRA